MTQPGDSQNEAGSESRITLRVRLANQPGVLARLLQLVADCGGNLGAIDLVQPGREFMVRDITLDIDGEEQQKQLIEAIRALEGVQLIHWSDRVFLMHLGGKIEVRSKTPLTTRDRLSVAYTPGVARVCMAIHEDPDKVHTLTIKSNTVAIVTDGTAVLGLGDIGPEAALPVMEGKAMLFKEFAGVNAVPICLGTKNSDAIVETVKHLAPAFGGINLEDIAAPNCFDVEQRLARELDIPVFHDDQHGTAVVVSAALLNALKLIGKRTEDLRVVVSGVGAAGTACARMLQALGVRDIIGCDRRGALVRDRSDLNASKRRFAQETNPSQTRGTLKQVIRGSDVFLGLSGPDLLDEQDVEAMNPNACVFALANPRPEIMPEIALRHVRIMATGRSDFPNQINNVLCFPGLFRGALDCRAREINQTMLMAAVHALANVVSDDHLTEEYIIPSVFDKQVVPSLAAAVSEAAVRTGVARTSKASF